LLIYKGRTAEERDQQMSGTSNVLYHYTNARGLLGILKENALWASNVSFMNDFSELKYTKDLLDRELQRIIKNKANLKKLNLNNIFNVITDGFNAYACCFCEDGDQLSQWRAYSEAGTGYALGFDEQLLQSKLNGVLGKVIYKRERQIKHITPVVEAAADKLLSFQKERSDMDKDQQYQIYNREIGEFLKKCISFFFVFKDPAFEVEQESRLLAIDNINNPKENVQFREMRGKIIPYVELKVKQSESNEKELLPIVEIVQGPLADQELGMKSLNLLLNKEGYKYIRIRKSNVPLRF
jgi:hypothetical protein